MTTGGAPQRRGTRALIRCLALLCLLAPALPAQSPVAEIAQLRAELARASVRIDLLERAVLSAPAPPERLTTSRVDLASPPPIRTLTRQAAPASSGYTRGPKGGCYTISASGRKKYADRSLCE